MGSLWLFLLTSCLLNGSLRGQKSKPTSGCFWDNMYSYSCTSTGITDLDGIEQGSKKVPSWPSLPRLQRTIKKIDLSNNMISSLHIQVFHKFFSLETLNVSNNYISVVLEQKWETALPSLRTFWIDRNRLTLVPKGLGRLPSLQTLNLSANSIVRIQRDDFANCTQLHNLDLGNNRIYKIDADAFRDLRNLQILRLSNNALVSITPLVFLYGHILRADIDLSYNRWSCDSRILPLKQLLTSLPMGMKKDWNITCNTPLSRTGIHLLSIDESNGPWELPVHGYMYARRIIVKKLENRYLPCNITDTTGLNEAFWWTPQGILSRESSITNYYIDAMNNLMLIDPNYTHEGLYICIADMKRIVYQVHIQTNAGKTLIRRPRDTQLLNARIRTDEDFARAVVLSVVISFICAFLLGVFLRPFLERLWRKLCKSKNSNKNTPTEAYDNEGFSEENVSSRHSSNGPGSSLAVHVSKANPSSERDFEEPDSSKYDNITYNEREIYYKEERCNLDTQVPTSSELPERRTGMHEDVQATGNSHSSNSKKVTWASNVEGSPTVNLKHVMSLLKPINIIVPENTDHHDQNIRPGTILPKKNRGSFSYSTSSGESEFWDAEEVIVNYVSTQQVGAASDGHVIFTVNLRHVMSLLKPINFIVPESTTNPAVATNYYEGLSNSSYQFKDSTQDYESNLSDDGSSSSVEDPSSEEGYAITRRATTDNDSSKVNIKHVTSLVKPINIVVPEFTECDIVKSPTRKQFFPIVLQRDPEYRMENIYDQHFQNNTQSGGVDDKSHNTSYHSSSSDDGSIDFDYSSDEAVTLNPVLLPKKQVSLKTNIDTSPTVNLRQVISLLKPINITASVSDLERNPLQETFHPSSIPRLPEQRMEERDNLYNNYPDMKQSPVIPTYMEGKETSSDSSSSEDESREHHSSDRGNLIPHILLPTWTRKEDNVPTVNLQHLMSLVKPINLIIPESKIMDPGKKPADISFIPTSVPKYPEHRTEDSQLRDSSSSDDGSEFDYDDSSDEEVKLHPGSPVTKQTSWTSNTDSKHTVNLKQVIALLKPINIIAPTFDNVMGGRDSLLYQSQELRDHPYDPKYEHNFVSSTRPTNDMGGKQISLDSSSSDNESKEDEEDHGSREGSIIPPILLPLWTRKEDNVPTVNLKHVMSLVKPINIIIPESNIIDLGKTPQVSFIPTSLPRYPEHRTQDSGSQDYDSSSSDDGSEFDYCDSSDVEVKLHTGSPLTKQTSWTSNTAQATVNLKQVISLLKPINIIAPKFENDMEGRDIILNQSQELRDQPCNPKYEHSFVSSTRPTSDMDGKHTSSDSSSSDDQSKEDEEDHSSDEEIKIIPGFLSPKQGSWTGNVDTSPTVNLRQNISLLKPISIIVPNFENRIGEKDTFLNQSQELRDPEYDPRFILSTRPTSDMDEKQRSSDSSSSDDESKEDEGGGSSDEENKIPPVWLTNQPAQQKDIPTVNLKHVMSLVKPINITFPESTKIDLVKSPSQTQLIPGSVSQYPEHRMEEIENLYYHKDMNLHGEPQNKPYHKDQSSPISPTPSVSDGDGKKAYSDSSSSDDTIEASSDEEVKVIPGFLPTKQTSWTSIDDVSPTVNLQQVISLLKPISIVVPNFDNRVEENDNLLNQPQELRDRSTDEKYEPSFILSSQPTNDMKGKQTSSESSSSDDESKEDEEDHSSDEESVIPSIVITKETTLATQENIIPTVNLKHVMSLVKPINITFQESTKIDIVRSPSLLFPDSISQYPEHRMENLYQDANIQGEPENQPYNKDDKSPALPISDGEENKTLYDSSSSDDTMEASSDDEVALNSGLLLTTQPAWTRNGNESPKVNLQQVISLLKPINIIAPNYSVTEPVGNTLEECFFPTSSSSEALLPSAILTSKQIYYSSTSEDESDSDHASDEEIIENSDLLIRHATWTPKENVSPIVNLRRAMSLRPINIIVPEYTAIEKLQSPSQKHFFSSVIPRIPEQQIEDMQLSTEPQYQSHSANDKALSSPTEYKESIQRMYDSSSSEDESKMGHSLDEDVMYLPTTKAATWTSKDVVHSVNLKQVMSLLKPINIVSPEPVIDIKMYYPHGYQYIEEYSGGETQSQDVIYEKHSSDIIPRATKHERYQEIPYDSSSSENGSEQEEDNSSDEGGGMNSDLLVRENDTWTSLESISPNVNLGFLMSLVNPINIKAPDSTVTEALRRFQEKYNVQVCRHQTVNQLENTTLKDPSIDKPNIPKTTIDEESKHFVYEPDLESDTSKANTQLLTWKYEGNANPKVNLKHTMSLLKPIHIIAPYYTSTMDVKSPEQKYILNIYQPDDRMEDADAYNRHHDQDNRYHTGSSTEQLCNTSCKGLNSSNSDIADSFYKREDEPRDIKHSAHVTPNQAPLVRHYSTSPKVNLKHLISLLKPINIVIPDTTLTDTVESPTKVLLGDRLSHNTVSEYFTDNINDSSSDDGSFFSFSRSNSLSDDSEKIDIAKGKEVGVMDIQSSKRRKEIGRSKISPPREYNVNELPEASGKNEAIDVAEGGYEPNKAKDVFHWLNTNTNDEQNYEFPSGKNLPTKKSEQEPVFDLNSHKWTTRTIVIKETLTTSRHESKTFGNSTFLMPDLGESSTDGNLIDFTSNDLPPELDGKIQKVVSSTVDHSTSKHHGSYFTNRRVFDAFSETFKNEQS